jgi:hypothetical protein
VLWRNSVPGSSQVGQLAEGWYIEAGAPDFKVCSDMLQQRLAEFLAIDSERFARRKVGIDRIWTVERKNGEIYEASHFVCLSDSVDPPSRQT